MKTMIYGLLLLTLIVSPSLSMTASWANWILPNWTPDWSYNISWTAVNPATFGFYRKTFTSPTAPGYTYRYNHYMFISSSNPAMSFACGPESYLRSDYLCERNPLYWDVAAVGALCQPDYISYNFISACMRSGSLNCCYKTNTGDLYSFNTVGPTIQYPPGS